MKKFILSLTSLLIVAVCTIAQVPTDKKPAFSDTLLFENWSSASFVTNQWDGWQLEPCLSYGLTISTDTGNPAPSAKFNLSEFYYCHLTSRQLACTHRYTELRYDVYIIDSSHNPLMLNVEMYDGATWHAVEVFDFTSSMPWTTHVVDISEGCGIYFKIRFRSYGAGTLNDYMYLDNINIGSFPLGMQEQTEAGVTIRPNPATSSFEIVLKNFENQKTQISLLDMTGRVLCEEEVIPGTGNYSKHLNVSSFPRGICFCKIESEKVALVRKVIIE